MYDFEYPAPETLSKEEMASWMAKTETLFKAIMDHHMNQLKALLEKAVG